MKTLIITTASVLVVGAVAFSVFPSLRGPFNRIRNNANEAMNSEYVVDNYKANYIKLNEQKTEVNKRISYFRTEWKVAEKKLEYANTKAAAAKEKLIADGSEDLKRFEANKSMYESILSEIKSQENLIATYSNAVAKLETSLELVNAEMRDKRQRIEELASKKAVLDAMKNVNKTVENLNGIGEDAGLDFGIEKLEDDTLRESVKLDALTETAGSEKTAETAESAKAYLDSLK